MGNRASSIRWKDICHHMH